MEPPRVYDELYTLFLYKHFIKVAEHAFKVAEVRSKLQQILVAPYLFNKTKFFFTLKDFNNELLVNGRFKKTLELC